MTPIQRQITDCVAEFLEMPEANEGAQVCIDTLTGEVVLMPEEEADNLPDTTDVYDVMDFITMTPDGKWKADPEAIASVETE